MNGLLMVMAGLVVLLIGAVWLLYQRNCYLQRERKKQLHVLRYMSLTLCTIDHASIMHEAHDLMAIGILDETEVQLLFHLCQM